MMSIEQQQKEKGRLLSAVFFFLLFLRGEGAKSPLFCFWGSHGTRDIKAWKYMKGI